MRKFRLFVLPTLLSACALALLTPDVGAWQIMLRDFPRSSARAQAVVIDAAGDVISAGTLPPFSVVKMSGTTGEVKWRFSSALSATPTDIAVDSNGDVFVASTTRAVIKLSGADGTHIWSKPVGGASNAFQSYLFAVKVDGNGDVVTAGSVGGLFNVSKLNGRTGDQKWHYEREGYSKAVAVDLSGNVAAAGISNKNFAVVKLRGSDGAELWERELNGVGFWTDVFEEANAVVMGSDGSVVAAGNTANIYANTRDFTVVKYAPDGTRLWSHAIDGKWCVINFRDERVCQSNDEANAITLSEDGSVFVAGSMQTDADAEVIGANEHFFVAKFSKEGAPIWGEAAEDYPRQGEYTPGRAVSVSVDSSGNVVAAGQHGGRFTVIKYMGDGARAGERVWSKQPGLPPTPGNHGSALEVVSDADDNVVITGETLAEDQFSLYSVVKLWGANGESYFGPPEPPPATQVPATVLTYAPIVRLHPDDEYRPGDPATFIYNSDLLWFHEGGCSPDLVQERPKVEPLKLSTGDWAYFHNAILPRPSQGDPCLHSNITFYAGDYTRPYDGPERSAAVNNYWWDKPFYEREGFYLDLRDDEALRHGIPSLPDSPVYPGAPVFFEYVPGQYVTYWFFYPYNEFSFPDGVNLQFHEGDWERVSIQLNEHDEPLRVFYYGHGDGQEASWTEVERFETHPIVYSAKGSHASYPHPGLYPTAGGVPDQADSGPGWHTWGNLRDVERQPWFGFGGAWGEVGEPHPPIRGGEFTGPLGPSAHKNSKARWVRSIGGRVSTAEGVPLPEVKVTLTDALGNTLYGVTDDVGHYSFKFLKFGREYTVTPSKPGYSFNPPGRTFSPLTENQTADFSTFDTVAPVLSLPRDLTVNASIPLGAVVNYTVTATDNVTANPHVSCSPRPGDIFPIGITTVICVASDEAGNRGAGSFRVMVRGAADQAAGLIFIIQQLGLKESVARRLQRDLEQAQKALRRGDTGAACRDTEQFIKEVMREVGKGLTPEQGRLLDDAALQIRTAIGCR